MKRNLNRVWILALVFGLMIMAACSDDGSSGSPQPDGDSDASDQPLDGDGEQDADGDLDMETDSEDRTDGDTEGEAEPDGEPEPTYDPWMVLTSDELPAVRGYQVRRGIVHSHSPYSHDACDDEPFPEGVRNEQCFEDCRLGMCATGQDFVFLSDHATHFAEYEFPDVLLYKEGDSLIERGDAPVANRVACENGREVIVAAGTETAMMPIGLERHVAETVQERKAIYGENSADAVRALQEAGALVFLQHTEGWDVQTILDYPIDGIEMYNLHQNMMTNMGAALEMILRMETEPEMLPEMELAIISVFKESEEDLMRWSKAVMQKPMPAVLATDVHQNTFKGESPDGERLDSFRRLMRWFANYVLVPEGAVDDAVLKEAIAHGRMYGAFDYLGYPVGFDFHASAGETVYEMGDETPGVGAVELHVSMPEVWKLDPNGEQPEMRAIILKANDGEWVEVAQGEGDLDVSVEPGAYRAEIRMTPKHLRPWLGGEADRYVVEYIWVYSNPIYVGGFEKR